jgi:hypothetical protein
MQTKIVLKGVKLESYQINVDNEGTRYTIEGFIQPPAKKEKKK